MPANDRQVGGHHYTTEDDNYQHWDFTWQYQYNQFEYCISKYILRHRFKDGLQGLQKAQHYLEKYISVGLPVLSTSPNERGPMDVLRICRLYKADIVEASLLTALHMRRLTLAMDILEALIADYPSDTECEAEPGFSQPQSP